jgi:hypothetical protein
MSSECQLQAFEGSYDWMLYGHDDTFFFVEGILDLLQDFDPALPYIITGVNTLFRQLRAMHCCLTLCIRPSTCFFANCLHATRAGLTHSLVTSYAL